MPEWWSIEYQRSELQIPKEFEDVKNLQDFRDVYADIVDRYGENFSDAEKTCIKDLWNRGCQEYWPELSKKINKRILKNRIDSWLFELRYPEFLNINVKIIRQFGNADVQRNYRDVAIKLYKQLGVLSSDDVKYIMQSFAVARAKNMIRPDFEQIRKKLKPEGGVVVNLSNWWNLNIVNLKKMVEKPVPKYFELMEQEFKKADLSAIDLLYYLWVFHEVTNNVIKPWLTVMHRSDMANQVLSPNSDEYKDILNLFVDYFSEHDLSDWLDVTVLSNEIGNIFFTNHKDMCYEGLSDVCNRNSWQISKILQWKETWEIEKIDDDVVNFILAWKTNINKDEAINTVRAYAILEKKVEKWETLSPDEQSLYDELKPYLSKSWFINKLIRLERLDQEERRMQGSERINPMLFDVHEVSKWNLQSMWPEAIVENNRDVRRFIYGQRDKNIVNNQPESEHSLDYDAELYDRLVEQRRWDPEFMETIKYIKKDWSIDMDLVNQDGVDLASVQNNQREVQSLLTDMAREDFHDENMRNRINGISTRKSIMTCCFRAISQYFDKTNENGENFAHEFQLDVNSDISFDGDIISMKWMMWLNYVWLYYDVSTWMLSFDNFLDFDVDNKSYVLWTNNGRKELMNIKLPTMNEMMNVANTVDFANISSNVEDMHEYRLSVEHAVDENVWNACFMWMDMLNNRSRVELFNEKNLLKQDIIRNIYTNYYNSQDLDVLFSWKFEISAQKPEQYKLIWLIYRSISNCKSAEELLKFRNLINNLDNLLWNSEVVEWDSLLQYLFADNVYDKNDIYDQSRNIVEKENGEIPLWDEDVQWKIYESDNIQNPNSGNAALNYYTLLDLISEWTGEDRIINLSAFESMVATLSKKWQTLKDLDNVIYVDNLLDKQISGELPWLEEENQYTFA